MNSFQFTDSSSIPVGTFYCIGRNYAAHAKEMNAVVEEQPLIFLKPPTAFCESNSIVTMPSVSKDMHFEGEIVVIIAKDAFQISPEEVGDYIAGIGVGFDLTLRDIQSIAKTKGHPWAVAKGFRHSAPISSIIPYSPSVNLDNLSFSVQLNGDNRQNGNTSQMERSIKELIVYVSSIFELQRGDCIFTGTPEGVGSVSKGSTLSISFKEFDIQLQITIDKN